MKYLDYIEKIIVKIIEVIVSIFTALLVVDVVWQVASRYVFNVPCSWSTEVATILLIWITLLGAAIAFARKGHLGFDYLVNKLSKTHKTITEYLVLLSMGFFTVFVFIGGGTRLVYLVLITHQMSPVLGVRIGYFYTVIPICGVIMLFFIIRIFIEKILGIYKEETV
jgi:TRAP-type C4-dicarboxylate transport system permease small subunit